MRVRMAGLRFSIRSDAMSSRLTATSGAKFKLRPFSNGSILTLRN